MALNEKAKKFIREHPRLSSSEIASKIQKSIEDVEAYRHILSLEESTSPLRGSKVALFWALTLAIPVLFFISLELGLRWGNYRGNTNLFLRATYDEREFLTANSNFAARYFFYTNVIPNPAAELFKAAKDEKVFRVFALGGSSTAGYPYSHNAMFSRVVRDVLTDAMPNRDVEVLNLGISAINTYTIYDQIDEILAQKPDAIMLYAGHNEYYGALGVGSSESMGSFPAFVRFYLKIQRLKTFMLVRDGMTRLMRSLGSIPKHKETGTLMERVVREQIIPYESPLFELGKIQFESNMKAIIKAFKRAGVPVYIGNLVSNEKDHVPFESVAFGNHPPAKQVFENAQTLLAQGKTTEAAEQFKYARDLDALRFRASTSLNQTIKNLAEQYDLHFVDVESDFRKESPNGIIGKELMLEHLHPNHRGYFLMGKAFAHAISIDLQKKGLVELYRVKSWEHYFKSMYLSEYDLLLSEKRVFNLMNNWPFVKVPRPSPALLPFSAGNPADSLSSIVVAKDTNWERAKVELASIYIARGDIEKAIYEFEGLRRDQPYNDSPLDRIAQLLLDKNQFERALPYLQKSYALIPGAFNAKMLGATMIHFGRATEGVKYLEESLTFNKNDAQAIYNLSGGYFMLKQYDKATFYADRLLEVNPKFPGALEWRGQLNKVQKN